MTYFCQRSQISYKQGLNEVLAPFFHLACQRARQQSQNQQYSAKIRRMNAFQLLDSNLNLSEPYAMGLRFVARFQTNIFIDSEFHALQGCLCLLKMLLGYH
jgi:hypothetical protein